jgi:plasmid stabilization system protein ParE
MNLRIDPSAEDEIRSAAAWYEECRSGLGVEFLAAVDDGVQRVSQAPESFPRLETLPEEESVRRLVLSRFPYAIIFELSDDCIHILAVAHARRRPGYWEHRH